MTLSKAATWQYPYEPSVVQQFAHSVTVDELLYGGAAGGGKTEFLLASAMALLLMVPNSKALLLRRTLPEIEQEIEPRLLARIPSHIGQYHTQKHTMTFFNGSILRMGYLENDKDMYRYSGAEYQLIMFDELTTMNMKAYEFLSSRCRAAGKVWRDMLALGLKPRMMATSNPGGRSHGAVKRKFVDPMPPKTVYTDAETGQTRMFIPALLQDNPHVDPGYKARLQAMPEHFRRALLNGDWTVLDGVRFAVWQEAMHVCLPYSPEELYNYPRVVAVDYGFSAPFAAVWLAKLPDGTIVQYRELYAKELTAKAQAKAILAAELPGERMPGIRPLPVVMDPSMWKRGDGGTIHLGDKDAPPVGSPAHDYQQILGQRPIKAYNARVPGWALMDSLLEIQEDGRSRLQVFNTCRDTIRTIPELPRAKTNPEDVDTTSEDHLADALRYGAQFLAGKRQKNQGPDLPETFIPPMTAGLAKAGF